MAQILIRAIDNAGSSSAKKGDIIVAMPDSHVWGRLECPPGFVVIACSAYTPAQVESYRQMWRDDFSYSVIASTPAQGLYTIQVTNNGVSTSGVNALTLNKVNDYLTNWGCSNISLISANTVQFDMRLWQMVQSNGFWGRDVSAVTFTLNSYDAGTGVADITATMPDNLQTAQMLGMARGTIEMRGGTVTGSVSPSITFTIERSSLFERFKINTAKMIHKLYAFRRYYIDPAVVDQALLLPKGVMTMTGTELLAAVKDRWAD